MGDKIHWPFLSTFVPSWRWVSPLAWVQFPEKKAGIPRSFATMTRLSPRNGSKDKGWTATLKQQRHCCPWLEISCTTEARDYSSPTARQWREVEISDGTDLELLLPMKGKEGQRKTGVPHPIVQEGFMVWGKKDAPCHQAAVHFCLQQKHTVSTQLISSPLSQCNLHGWGPFLLVYSPRHILTYHTESWIY